MILIIGGTADGRGIAKYFRGRGHKVTVTVATSLGVEMLNGLAVEVVQGRLDASGLRCLLTDKGVRVVVDASHPFAVEISQLAQQVCSALNIGYVRFERTPLRIPDHPLVELVSGWEEAVQTVQRLPGSVMLTVGVKPLPILHQHGLMESRRVVARVLPEQESIKICRDCHVDEVIAFRGVAGKELNMALFHHYQIGVVLTKESGSTGGADVKIAAALDMRLPVVVVKRPEVNYICKRTSFHGIEQYIKERGFLCRQ